MIVEDNVKQEIIEEEINNKNTENSEFKSVKQENNSHNLLKITGIFLLLFLILIVVIFGVFTFYNYTNHSVISKGVYVYGTNLSGLNKDEAKQKLQNSFGELLSNDITLIRGDYITYIKPSEINLSFDIDSAIDYAYRYGKDNNIFIDNLHTFSAILNGINITPKVTYDEKALEEILNQLSYELPDAVVESGYYIENNDLIITKGKPGNVIDVNLTTNNIIQKLTDLSYLNEAIEIETKIQSPKEVDIAKIHDEIYSEAKDAYYTIDPYMVSPSSNGVDFKISIEEASNLLSNSDTECTIPLKTL